MSTLVTLTNVSVWMVTMAIIVRNKMIVTPATTVLMEELALIKMATTLAAVHLLGLECTVNVSHIYVEFNYSCKRQ